MIERVRDRYAVGRGRPGADPAGLFRFMGLINVREIGSLVDGRRQVRQMPLLARICGWESVTDIPAVGTIYGCLRRLYPEAQPHMR